MSNLLPNFLILGAAKSGTTSLYRYLKQHPEIFLADKKETNFFACKNLKLQDFRWEGRSPDFFLSSITILEEYQSIFKKASKQVAVGEVSTGYLYSRAAPEHIRKFNPQVKLIAILRNPIERAYSHYLQLRREQREPLENFTQALLAELLRIHNNYVWDYFYKDQGYYFQQLQRYYALFPTEQIRVYFYEELESDVSKLVSDLFSFIGVTKDFPLDTSFKFNTGGIPIHPWFGRLISSNNRIRTSIKYLLSPKKRQEFKKLYLKLFFRPAPPLPDSAYELLRDAYQDDISKLQELFRRDLSTWLTQRTI
jgi:hypothetical protein